mmetsp:Transcript_9529/g.13501  ORF Transcript_9529/g.13501 Transcript_9529/m.13501 type:complete len:352 (+) Transcript_9529:3702-4757(+)
MEIRINDDGTVSIDVSSYIKEIISGFPEEIKIVTTSPAGAGLFTIPKIDTKLDKCSANFFHSIVEKLLWLIKRGRPNIEVPVSFLCTRVQESCWSDWLMLRCVLVFLKHTTNDVRKIGMHNVGDLITMVDASYAVHQNMRGHTGGLMTMGRGFLHSKSSKQKFNAKSPTESEVVGVSEYLPYFIWMNHFLEAQGYKIKNNILYQDNMSAIKMEKNGHNSCTGNSRHIHIQFFFVKYKVDKGKIVIYHCPTDGLVADFYTKLLQDKLFHLICKHIMGWCTLDELYDNCDAIHKVCEDNNGELNGMKECVGTHNNTHTSSNVNELNILSTQSHQKNTNETEHITWADVVRSET